MPSSDDIKELQKRLSILRQTLTYLLEQRAIYGSEAALPLPTRHLLDETRKDITRIKVALRAWGEKVEDLPDDAPPTPVPQTQSSLAPPAQPAPSRQLPPPSPRITETSCDLGALRVHLSPLPNAVLVEFENRGSAVLQSVKLTFQRSGALFITPGQLGISVLDSYVRQRAGTIRLSGNRGASPLTVHVNASYSRTGATLSDHIAGILSIDLA